MTASSQTQYIHTETCRGEFCNRDRRQGCTTTTTISNEEGGEGAQSSPPTSCQTPSPEDPSRLPRTLLHRGRRVGGVGWCVWGDGWGWEWCGVAVGWCGRATYDMFLHVPQSVRLIGQQNTWESDSWPSRHPPSPQQPTVVGHRRLKNGHLPRTRGTGATNAKVTHMRHIS